MWDISFISCGVSDHSGALDGAIFKIRGYEKAWRVQKCKVEACRKICGRRPTGHITCRERLELLMAYRQAPDGRYSFLPCSTNIVK